MDQHNEAVAELAAKVRKFYDRTEALWYTMALLVPLGLALLGSGTRWLIPLGLTMYFTSIEAA